MFRRTAILLLCVLGLPLGSKKKISWTQEDYYLSIDMPEEQISECAVVIKMELN